MTEELLKLEQFTHQCSYMDIDAHQKLDGIIHKIVFLIEEHYRGGDGSAVLNDILIQLQEAECHLDDLKEDDTNINDWKHNVQTFSNAKANIQYALNRFQAAIRFNKLHLIA